MTQAAPAGRGGRFYEVSSGLCVRDAARKSCKLVSDPPQPTPLPPGERVRSDDALFSLLPPLRGKSRDGGGE